LANNALQEQFSRRFRRLLSGDPNGVPPWLEVVAAGDEPGLYLPGDAPWVVHADFSTLVGGVRALLMQALHPGSLTGVKQHSRYKQDPLGRLSGTIRWLTVTTFGSRAAVEGEASRVNRMHERVVGSYSTANSGEREYRASDKDLLLWVHVAFMDSFLRSHQNYSLKPIPGGADNYVSQWSHSVEPLGLSDVPRSDDELKALLDRFLPELVVTDDTREVIAWLKRPPLPLPARPFYWLFFQAALASLPANYRELLGLRSLPLSVTKPITTTILRIMRFAIGPDSPIEDAAIERLKRAGALPESFLKVPR
jgi:uncharacterized protein (DUF2236 family)